MLHPLQLLCQVIQHGIEILTHLAARIVLRGRTFSVSPFSPFSAFSAIHPTNSTVGTSNEGLEDGILLCCAEEFVWMVLRKSEGLVKLRPGLATSLDLSESVLELRHLVSV